LPEADDEWASSLAEDIDSLETLRGKIRADLENRMATEADHRVRSELMKQLLAAHQFEVPESLIDHQTNYRMESVVRDMIGKGIDPRQQEFNWEGAHEELKSQAEADVRGSLLLERIAEEEKIEVSPEEIEAEIESVAAASRQPKEQVRAVLTKDGGERSIANRLRNRKALDLLLENAQIKDEEWREETPAAEVSSDSAETAQTDS
jgi:trigger factor